MKKRLQFRMPHWILAVNLLLCLGGFRLPAQDVPADKNENSPATQVEEDQSDRPTRRLARIRQRHNAGDEKVAVMENVLIRSGETAREVVVICGTATIDGDVEGNVVVVGGKAIIKGRVNGELVLILSPGELGPEAEVSGNTTIVGGPLKADPAAKFLGEIHEVAISSHLPSFEWLKDNFLRGVLLRPLPPGIGWAWLIGLIFFGLHLFVALLFPRPVQVCVITLADRPVRSFIVGVLILILSIPMMILLLATFVGTPLLLCALIVSTVLGKVAVYCTAGGQVGHQFNVQFLERPLIALTLGTIIFYLAYMIPILGWIIWFVITPLGLGAVVLSALGLFRREGQKQKPPSQPPAAPPPSQTVPPSTSGPTPATVHAQTAATWMPSDASIPEIPTGGTSATAGAAAISGFPPVISNSPEAGLSSAELASLPRVGFWPRLGATFLDAILIAILNAATFHNLRFFFLLMVAYHVGMWVWKGTTVGGIVLGLKCVRADGRPLDWSVALVRSLSSFISLAVFGLGFFWASWNPERQSWHDIIAGTTIVKLPKTTSLI